MVTVWLWYRTQDRRLSEVPERSAQELTLPERTSSLQVKLAIPHAVLARVADEEMPAQMRFSGHGDDVCVDLGLTRPCVGTRYDATLERLDGVSVERDGRDLSIVLPIAVWGNGGFRGDGARLLGLDAKNFRARARVDVSLSMDLSPDWCLQVKAEIGSEWIDSPRVEIIDGVEIDLGHQVDGQVDDALEGLAAEIERAVPCEPLRNAIAELWQVRSIPLDLRAADAFLNLSPRALDLSRPQITDTATEMVVDVQAATEISTRQVAGTTQRPLPRRQVTTAARAARIFGRMRNPEQLDRLDLALAIRADYGTLETRLQQALGSQAIEVDTPGGPATVTIRGVEVYPSGERLAVGVDLEADVPARFLDVEGTVYVTGVPRATPDGLGLELTDVAVARRLDHPLWQVLAAVFERRLVREIEAQSRIDLAAVWQAAEESFETSLSQTFREAGITVETKAAEARVVDVVPEAEHLGAVLEVSKPMSLTLEDLPVG